MTRVMRVTAIACMIVLLGYAAASASGDSLRRIVTFQDGTSEQTQRAIVAQSGSKFLRALPLVNGASIKLPSVGADAAVSFLASQPAVTGVYQDPVVKAHGDVVPTGAGGDGAGGDGAGGDGAGGDGAGGDHVVYITPVPAPRTEVYPWGIDRIGAAAVQQQRGRSYAGEGVKIAVLDTGLDRHHPDLKENIVGGFNAIAGADPDAWDDDNGHGTAMAGIIAARLNKWGVIGGAPKAKLFAVKVLDKDGKGHTSDGIYALGVLAERKDIRVLNMSYGTALVWPLFQVAIQRAHDLGKIIVTSRGNGCTISLTANGAGGDGAGGDGAGGDGAGGDAACSPYAVKYPAAYPEVITVGATTAQDEVATYSLWGGVDVVAPGGDSAAPILTTNVGGGYGHIVGTSPAAAHVTAAVALALSVQPRLSPDWMVGVLQLTANHLDCPRWPHTTGCPVDQQGAGLIDVDRLLDLLKWWR